MITAITSSIPPKEPAPSRVVAHGANTVVYGTLACPGHVCRRRYTAIKILVSLLLSFGHPTQFLPVQDVLHLPLCHSNSLSPWCSHGHSSHSCSSLSCKTNCPTVGPSALSHPKSSLKELIQRFGSAQHFGCGGRLKHETNPNTRVLQCDMGKKWKPKHIPLARSLRFSSHRVTMKLQVLAAPESCGWLMEVGWRLRTPRFHLYPTDHDAGQPQAKRNHQSL